MRTVKVRTFCESSQKKLIILLRKGWQTISICLYEIESRNASFSLKNVIVKKFTQICREPFRDKSSEKDDKPCSFIPVIFLLLNFCRILLLKNFALFKFPLNSFTTIYVLKKTTN